MIVARPRPAQAIRAAAMPTPASNRPSGPASSGPPIAPRLSIACSNPYARPYTCARTTSASSALRAGTHSPHAVQAAARNTPACHGATAAPIAEDSTAVDTYPPTST
jgi:hypothetical protein